MKKKHINTILLSEAFFEIASFSFKKADLQQENFLSGILEAGVIKSALEHNRLDLRKEFLAVVPRHQVTVKQFELPSMSANEVEKMINFQLQDALPYRLEDLILQNLIRASYRAGYSKATSVIVQKDLIDKFLEITKVVKIKISNIALSTSVLAARFKALYKRESFFQNTNLLINIEEKTIDFVFIKNGDIVLSRGALLNKDNFQEALLNEIKQSLSLFYNRTSEEIRRVFLWGRNYDLKALRNLIASELSLKIEVNENENLLKSLACSLRAEKSEINLIPGILKDRKKHSLKKKKALKAAFSVSIILLFLVASLFIDFKEKERHLGLLSAEIKKIEKEARDIQAKRVINEATLMKQTQSTQSLDVLAELYALTQPGIFFNSFSLVSGKSILIKGQAEELDKILEFVSKLETSALFKNVELKYTNKRRLRDKDITDFEVAFFVNQPTRAVER